MFLRAAEPLRTLHVYLDGDGSPWRRAGPTPDPTPRNPLVLELMALDPAPSAYVGRPCYHGLAAAPACSSALWTAQRYSPAVVSSMEAAVRALVRRGGYEALTWVGYSGGGTLAVLLAPRFPETTDLVTIAANLDIDAWTAMHRHDRLAGSLNPATLPPLPPTIRQRHYVGARDWLVPPKVTARGPIPRDSLRIIPDYDHACCWKSLWPTVLSELAATAAPPR